MQREFEILDQFIKESGRYPEPEEFAHILSVRTGREYSTFEARRILMEHYWNYKRKMLEESIERGIKELEEGIERIRRTEPPLNILNIARHWFRKR